MSKQSKRHTRAQYNKKQATGPALVQTGKEAFQQANYNLAIKSWEQALDKPNPPDKLAPALAEAYFRRALTAPSPRPADLRQAVDLHPADPRYRYHLALTYHRKRKLAEAEALYRELLAESPSFKRALLPLGQLLIEQKKALRKDPLWKQLAADERAQLAAADALITRKAASTLRRLLNQPLDPLWRGLIAVALKETLIAQQALQEAIDETQKLPPLPRSVAHYYLGVLDAADEQLTSALAHWQLAQSDGVNSRHLQRNLADMAHRQAINEQQAGRPQQAAALLEQFCDPYMLNHSEFGQQLNLDLAHREAQQGNWTEALRRWLIAERRGEKSRRLTFNLALAYQRTENYWESAEYWRSVLRRRPRKASNPDALSDKQVARIWQNIAENYSKAGDYDEAIKTYKNAVKWAPDNLELRLNLVEAYQNEGRWRAAENELHRVLDKNPDHIPALILLGDSYSYDYFPGRARKIWFHILELEPKHPIARQQLAHSYEEEGARRIQWGAPAEAINIYQEGLKRVPDSQSLLTATGDAYVDLGKIRLARRYFEQARAINPDDLHTLHSIYRIWLKIGSEPDLQKTFEHIKAVSTPIPGSFFLDLFQYCYQFDREDEGEVMLDYVAENYGDDDMLLVGVALGYLSLENDKKALALLRRALKNDPSNAEANTHLGTLYHQMGQTRLAKRHWDKAEEQARKENNHLLLYRIKAVQDELVHGKQAPRNPIEMLMRMPPEARAELLKHAPPEVAEMLQNLDPDMLDLFMEFGGMFGGGLYDDDEDDFFFDDDEGDFFFDDGFL